MNNLCKALVAIAGSAVVYAVVTKVAEKFCEKPTQDDIEDITEEVMEELEDDFDEEVAENIFHRIGKEIKAQNRLTIGIVVLAAGIGIGGGLIASAYVKLPE